MNCETCQERLIDFACDALPAQESAQVRTHLESGCRACRAELDSLQETLALLALEAPPVAPPTPLKEQILARARASASTRAKTPATRSRWTWRELVPYVAVSLCAILAGIATVRWTDHRLEQQAALAREFERRMREVAENFPTSELRFASHHGAGDAAPACYLILDALAGELHFHAINLGAPAAGKTLELWLVTRDGQFHHIGPLPTDAAGNTAAALPLPAAKSLGEIARALVTEETTVGASPQGPERLSAEFLDEATR